ncbi:unnamed protein product [Caretta caretta]
MSFTFASPTQVLYNGATVKQVDVPTLSGNFGILAAHVPTLQVLKPGVVTVFAEDGTVTKYFVSSGSITVNADSSVQLLAEEVAALDMLDLTTANPGVIRGFCCRCAEAMDWGWARLPLPPPPVCTDGVRQIDADISL